jgi:hypothetical protein
MSEGYRILETTRRRDMHTLHWIAVEAENAENAVGTVSNNLDSYMSGNEAPSTWYDWFVVGGGRWNTAEGDDFEEAYKTKSNMVISYKEDPNAFRAKIDECIQQRVTDYNQYLAEVKETKVIDKLDNYGGTMSYDYHFYALNALLRFQMGEWCHDSWFFDMIADSTNASHVLSKIDSDQGENIYLVPVDFHF